MIDKEMRLYWALITGELWVALPGLLLSAMIGGGWSGEKGIGYCSAGSVLRQEQNLITAGRFSIYTLCTIMYSIDCS
jgi:hypothetical protein